MAEQMFNQYKILQHYTRMAEIAKGKIPPPVTASIEPCSTCNFDCIWCNSEGYREREHSKLSKSLLLRLPTELKEAGVMSVVFTGGGEPLMNFALIPALERYSKVGLYLGLITNGSAVKGIDDANEIVQNCRFVRVSLDAATPYTFAQVKRTDFDFNYILTTIGRLAEFSRMQPAGTGCKVGVSYLVNGLNMNEMEKCTLIVRQLGVDYIQFKPVFNGNLVVYSQPRLLEIEEQLALCKRHETDKFKVIYMGEQFIQGTRSFRRLYGKCLGNLLTANIMSNGKLNICCQTIDDETTWYGDLYKQSFSLAWQGEEHKAAIRRIDLKKCKPCKFEEYNKMLWAMANPPEHDNFI